MISGGSEMLRTPSTTDTTYTRTFPQHSHHVLQQLNLQRHYGVFCDVVLRIDKYDFKAHKCVLAAGCPKLQTMLYSMRQECGNILSLKDISVTGVRYILEFLYTGTLELKGVYIHDILAAAQYLEMRDVEKACLDYQYYKGMSTYSHILNPPDDTGYRSMSTLGGTSITLSSGSTSGCTSVNMGCSLSHLEAKSSAPPPMFSTPNLSVDSSYVEDYLHLIEQPGGTSSSGGISGIVSYPSPRSYNSSHCDVIKQTCAQAIKTLSTTSPVESPHHECKQYKAVTKDQATNTYFEVPGGTCPQFNTSDKSAKESITKNVKWENVIQKRTESEVGEEYMEKRQKRKRTVPVKLAKPECHLDEKEDVKFGEDTRDSEEEEQLVSVTKRRGRPRKGEDVSLRLRKGAKKQLEVEKKRGRKVGRQICYCEECGRHFSCQKALSKHTELHAKKQLFTCHVCGMKFPRTGELTRHVRKHTNEVFQCQWCDMTYMDAKAYKRHATQLHNQTRPFHCPLADCPFSTDRLSNLTRHSPIHSGIKTFLCTKCGKCFAQPDGLRHHMRCCLQIRSYLCDICGSKFNHLQSLKTHHLLHKGEKPYLCKDCGARFTDRCNYKRHRRIHDNSFPYPCEHCDKKFRHSNSLKAHMKKHLPAGLVMPAMIHPVGPVMTNQYSLPSLDIPSVPAR